GISIPQLLTITYLQDKHNYQASHTELKDYLQLNPSTVTGIISRLEKKGLVARLPSLQDRRVGIISLTAQGLHLLQNTPEPLHEQLTTRLAQLTPADLQQLTRSLHILSDFFAVEASPIVTGGTNIDTEERN
ncbi:MAG: MarR family transcriptional regulator, partial [Lewinella sp.]|nr:MarR family transcriptional regulator [Lewinella sp.]